MTSYSASDFSSLLHDTTINATTMETIVDAAIDTLNLFGADTISNMSGDAGEKTVSLTSKQHGAVVFAVRQIHLGLYKREQIGATSTLGPSFTINDVLANPTIVETIKLAAKKLSPIAFKVGEATR
jgi:hypothetical protein